MPQSEEGSPPSPDAKKTLVHGSDGHYYIIFKNGITKQLTPDEEDHINGYLLKATDDLTTYFNQPGHDTSLASGVKIRMAELF
ncbi:MAG TPA: hypothetical protein VHY59_07005 [Chthoniobacterales bacterium]|jgi:hypothetical protein|nr:hypothetical protein [Chthoniobacterales bacterium]